AEGFGELHVVRVLQVGRDRPAVELLLLDTADIAVGAVVEDERDARDAVLRLGGKVVETEAETAVAVDRNDHLVRRADLGAERGRETPPERALVTGREVGARLLDWECLVA